MAQRAAGQSFFNRLAQAWRRLSSSLLGVAALGLALGIGIGLGIWLGESVDVPPPQPTPAATAPLRQPQEAMPAKPPGATAPQVPRITVAPWVPDPRRTTPELNLPPETRDPFATLPDAPSSLVPVPAPQSLPQSSPQSSPQSLPEVLPTPQEQGALSPLGAAPGLPADAIPAWRRNAVAAPVANGRPLIAIVIDDMGVDMRHSAEAAALPAPLTLAYLPYARDLPRQTAAARAGGHELMVHVSMEPMSRASAAGGRESGGDPGPNALTVGLAPEEIRRRLAWALGQFDGYVGINNHMGSRFTSDPAGMAVVIGELKSRGLLFLNSRTAPSSFGGDLAKAAGLPHAARHVFLDNVQSVAEVRKQLAETERIARASGAAIAIGHPHEATIAGLREWLPTAGERGFALAPLSAVVARAMKPMAVSGANGATP